MSIRITITTSTTQIPVDPLPMMSDELTMSLLTQIHTWADGPLSVWHDYRFLILFTCLFFGLITQIFLHQRHQIRRLRFPFPIASTPVIEKATPSNKVERPHTPSDYGGKDEIGSLQKATIDPLITSKAMKNLRIAPKKVIGPGRRRNDVDLAIQPLVFFSSLTGTTKEHSRKFAEDLKSTLREKAPKILPPCIHDLSYIDYEDFFVTLPKAAANASQLRYFYILLIPTYYIDTVMNLFLTHLQETHHDFRIDTAPLSGLAGYSVFGFGDKGGWPSEEMGFCSQAIEVDKWMAKLTGGKRAFPLGLGDVNSDVQSRLQEWSNGVSKVLIDIQIEGSLGEGIIGSGNALESDEEEEANADIVLGNKTRKKSERNNRVDDLEDLGGMVQNDTNTSIEPEKTSPLLPVDFTTYKAVSAPSPVLKEMVPFNSPTYSALTKQGYAIIGSHSGVKICRWTKSALRGRGSCYKYSFYGIKSHLCMETTPSLSCSNKCVFCWRHGTNPVGTVWRWKVDPPDLIYLGAKEAHLKKIKMMRGVPGVRAERFMEAMTIRHCALSLVGEPIFYPHINDFVSLLHADRISSFLVCNAQHPEQLEALKIVTQLYVSIDASNRESLKEIDRPLNRDFWERFLKCLDIIREKRFTMRTVYRLTLVKGFNIDDEVEGYAGLVARGLPCFVEIKGVTYCGTSSSGAGLTMNNVPFYEEIVEFVKALDVALARRGLEYGIAAEHAHSCCVLLASTRFLVEGKWRTLIQYERFFELLETGASFAPEDYMGDPTPEWATWGNGGFDPADVRVHRKGKNKVPLSSCSPKSKNREVSE